MTAVSNQKPLPTVPTGGIVVIALYIAAQLLSDIASLKITVVAGLSMDAGTFIYPFTFTIRDLVHKRLGIAVARRIILLAAGINLFMAFFFQFAAWLPPDPSWGLGNEFSAILGPVWRIVIASIVAEIISEIVDTEIYHLWRTRITKKFQWMRVLLSNAVSIPLDSLLFCWGAYGFLLPDDVVWSIFIANVLLKGAVTLISMPSIYLVKENPGLK